MKMSLYFEPCENTASTVLAKQCYALLKFLREASSTLTLVFRQTRLHASGVEGQGGQTPLQPQNCRQLEFVNRSNHYITVQSGGIVLIY